MDFYNIFGNFQQNKNIEKFSDELTECYVDPTNGEACGNLITQLQRLKTLITNKNISGNDFDNIMIKLKSLKSSMNSQELVLFNEIKELKVETSGLNMGGNLNFSGSVKAKKFYLEDGTELKTVVENKLAVPLVKGNIKLNAKNFIHMKGLIKFNPSNNIDDEYPFKQKSDERHMISINKYNNKGDENSFNLFETNNFNILTGKDFKKRFCIKNDGSINFLDDEKVGTIFNSSGNMKNVVSGDTKIIGKLQIGDEDVINDESHFKNHQEFTFFNHLTSKNEIHNKIVGDKTDIHGQVDFYYSDKLSETNNSHTTFNNIKNGEIINRLSADKNIIDGSLMIHYHNKEDEKENFGSHHDDEHEDEHKTIFNNREGHNSINGITYMDQIVCKNKKGEETVVLNKNGKHILKGDTFMKKIVFKGPGKKKIVLDYESLQHLVQSPHEHIPYHDIDLYNNDIKDDKLFEFIEDNDGISYINAKFKFTLRDHNNENTISKINDMINNIVWKNSGAFTPEIQMFNSFKYFNFVHKSNGTGSFLNVDANQSNRLEVGSGFTLFYYLNWNMKGKNTALHCGLGTNFVNALAVEYDDSYSLGAITINNTANDENSGFKKIGSDLSTDDRWITLIVVHDDNKITSYIDNSTGESANVSNFGNINLSYIGFESMNYLISGNFSIAGILNKALDRGSGINSEDDDISKLHNLILESVNSK